MPMTFELGHESVGPGGDTRVADDPPPTASAGRPSARLRRASPSRKPLAAQYAPCRVSDDLRDRREQHEVVDRIAAVQV